MHNCSRTLNPRRLKEILGTFTETCDIFDFKNDIFPLRAAIEKNSFTRLAGVGLTLSASLPSFSIIFNNFFSGLIFFSAIVYNFIIVGCGARCQPCVTSSLMIARIITSSTTNLLFITRRFSALWQIILTLLGYPCVYL